KDTYEDLTPESLEALIDDIAAGREVTPGPQSDRRFAMPEGGATTLTEIKDTTVGADPVAHVVSGAEAASHAFAGDAINAGGGDFDGLPGAAKVTAKAAPKPTPKAKAVKAETAETAAAGAPGSVQSSLDLSGDGVPESEPELLKGARDGKPDDLKKIKGVGPKIEGNPNDLGVYHFDQIAGWDEANKAWVDTRLKFKGRIDREDWIAQAKLLADGGDRILRARRQGRCALQPELRTGERDAV
ncbi:MAG: NADH-quinone oxidoreductase subunit E, partial [Alphaproteobacteria bacterium]|nr:NADH-quinone oxidoreductase subunit E [Alphaproteobacteria bacterium]